MDILGAQLSLGKRRQGSQQEEGREESHRRPTQKSEKKVSFDRNFNEEKQRVDSYVAQSYCGHIELTLFCLIWIDTCQELQSATYHVEPIEVLVQWVKRDLLRASRRARRQPPPRLFFSKFSRSSCAHQTSSTKKP